MRRAESAHRPSLLRGGRPGRPGTSSSPGGQRSGEHLRRLEDGQRPRLQASRAKPYDVRIGMLTLSVKDWGRVEAVMASRAAFLAKMLAGEMPRDIEDAF